MAKSKTTKPENKPAEKPETEVNLSGKDYQFLQDRRLIINGAIREYKKGDVIGRDVFIKNYPGANGDSFLSGLINAGILK